MNAAFPVRGTLGAEASDRERSDRSLVLGGGDLVADALRVDRVEIHPQRRIQRVVGRVIILDARDAEVWRVVAGVDNDAGDRRLADLCDEFRRKRLEFLGDQVRIPAAFNIEHPFVVEVEARLETVVGAEDLEREPRGNDLSDRGWNERLIGVLREQLIALGIHHEHDRRWGKGRNLLLEISQSRGGHQQQGKGEQARPHGDSSGGRRASNLRSQVDETQALRHQDHIISPFSSQRPPNAEARRS
jgi:hypothetical protein